MFKFSSNCNFTEKNIISLLDQKGMIIKSDQKNQDFYHIEISLLDKNLEISIEKEYLSFSLPFEFHYFFSELLKKLNNLSLNYSRFIYFPFKQSIIVDKREVQLRNTHNTIFKHLLLTQKNGISRKELYYYIWPNDKDIQINKLDTHLTNLKNYLLENLNLKLNIISQKNTVYLNLID